MVTIVDAQAARDAAHGRSPGMDRGRLPDGVSIRWLLVTVQS